MSDFINTSCWNAWSKDLVNKSAAVKGFISFSNAFFSTSLSTTRCSFRARAKVAKMYPNESSGSDTGNQCLFRIGVIEDSRKFGFHVTHIFKLFFPLAFIYSHHVTKSLDSFKLSLILLNLFRIGTTKVTIVTVKVTSLKLINFGLFTIWNESINEIIVQSLLTLMIFVLKLIVFTQEICRF